MVTDVILSALTNLFALFCSRGKVDSEMAESMLGDYLGRHFGIRNKEEYIALYSDLCELYQDMPELDIESVVEGICVNLKTSIKQEEGAMVLLRLMEFCSKSPDVFDPQDPLFTKSAAELGVSEDMLVDFRDFVTSNVSANVKITRFDGFTDYIKFLRLSKYNKVVFTYDGQDATNVKLNDIPLIRGMYLTFPQSGVLRCNKDKPVYYANIAQLYAKSEEERNIMFCGRHLEFRYPDSDNGLHDFSFDVHSGELVAIMGGSGAGKTTLLSVLNGNIPPLSGSITINGHSIAEQEAKALIGFVPQDDLLIEELTVYQNLHYTAKLCFDGMSDAEIEERVLKVLKDLDLLHAKDLKVGSPIKKYISGGQRKRLNIALELIREPSVLFLDEPTSGLSSSDTEKVILLLKEQTYNGRLIITNIHQPSSDVYKLFDRLWLLDRGGYPVFDGNPIEAITYFKKVANYADADASTCPVCGNVYPEIVLNIIEEKALDSTGSTSANRKLSPLHWHKMYLEDRKEYGDCTVTDVPHTEQKKPGVIKQWLIFMARNIKTKVTNLQYMGITFLEGPVLALICALLTHYTPSNGEYSLMDNKNLMSYLFMAVIVSTFVGMSGSAEEIIRDRALLKREKFLQLSYKSYIWSKIVLMAVISLVQTLLFVSVGNSVMGITHLFFVWWGILFVTALLANLTGLLLSQLLSSVVAIYITIPLLLIPQILLCGLVVSFTDLTPGSTTRNVPAIGNMIPSRWAFEALAVTNYTDNDYEINIFDCEKEKYENQYYEVGYLEVMRTHLLSLENERKNNKPVNPEHMAVIRTELPFVSELCNMPAYRGDSSFASLDAYIKKAKGVLNQRGNRIALEMDKRVQLFVRKSGKEEVAALKKNHFNRQLEVALANTTSVASESSLCDVVDGHILPNIYQVYLTPRTKWGNAPFYSSTKCVGDHEFKTLWFNMAVLGIMCIIMTVCLLFRLPARFVDKS